MWTSVARSLTASAIRSLTSLMTEASCACSISSPPAAGAGDLTSSPAESASSVSPPHPVVLADERVEILFVGERELDGAPGQQAQLVEHGQLERVAGGDLQRRVRAGDRDAPLLEDELRGQALEDARLDRQRGQVHHGHVELVPDRVEDLVARHRAEADQDAVEPLSGESLLGDRELELLARDQAAVQEDRPHSHASGLYGPGRPGPTRTCLKHVTGRARYSDVKIGDPRARVHRRAGSARVGAARPVGLPDGDASQLGAGVLAADGGGEQVVDDARNVLDR